MLNSTPFPSDLVPLFQNESSSKNEFYLNENKLAAGGIHFHMNAGFRTKRFDAEAKRSLEMAFRKKTIFRKEIGQK